LAGTGKAALLGCERILQRILLIRVSYFCGSTLRRMIFFVNGIVTAKELQGADRDF
jgi:hypothetical protein